MTRTLLLASLFALAACGASSNRQHVSFAHLTFDMPSDWTGHRSGQRGVSTSQWTPEPNDAKESVTIVRTELANPIAHVGSPALDSTLAAAASSLPGAHASTAFPIITKHGLEGVRVDVDFVPPGMHDSYHRVHVVLIDQAKATLIHVMYTSKIADEKLDALNGVLDTIREGEG